MSLTQDQIKHLQKLTALTGEDALEISSVVDSFSVLEKVDTSKIASVSRSGKWSLVPRPDVVKKNERLPEKLLECSPQKVAAHQIVLGGIMIGE
jgi:Asp-tRNA(Asn)/Glu-tRNA(Gln) amidotransferase C subunit